MRVVGGGVGAGGRTGDTGRPGPQPWGHPTGDFVAEHQALPHEQREQLNTAFESLLTQLSERGELISGEALGNPSTSRLYRWESGHPLAAELPERVAAVLDVLYPVFNEGYTRSSGSALIDTSLTSEAMRLTRQLQRQLPAHDEVAGALALMLLTQAREPARTDGNGDLIALADQDRGRWNRGLLAEG